MQKKRYLSKRGRFNSYNLLLVFILLIIGGLMAYALSYEVALGTVIPLLLVVFFSSTTYEITSKEIIRYYNNMAGLRLYVPDIQKVEKQSKGLKVWYSEKDFVWIKIKEEDQFLEQLKQTNPNILFV